MKKNTITSKMFAVEHASALIPIQFTHVVNDHASPTGRAFVTMTAMKPEEFENVKLIARGENVDTMAAWFNGCGSEEGVTIFFGHWNDGVVK